MIKDHAVLDSLAELVRMDVAAEDLQACLRVGLQQRSPGEADEDRIRHHGFHHAMKPAVLRAVAFIDKDEHFTHRVAGAGLQLFDELVELLVGLLRAFRPELVYQRADEARPRLAALVFAS